eukprot:c4191_g1_i2.p1 GENE.c4191_g1_i2~~c4191_g1_i2.p1  ORF type:complete len:218 (-),score=31.03 c4191_g1_i2:62-715(-)
MSFARNGMTGTLPTELAQLTKLSFLELSGNYFSGSIPSQFSALSSLWYWTIGNTPLSLPTENGPEICALLTECTDTSIDSSECVKCSYKYWEPSVSATVSVSPTISTSPSPVPIPPAFCETREHAELSCETLAKIGACDATTSENVPVKHVCAFSCGCCENSDRCSCDDDKALRQAAKARGFGWIKSCKQALQYTHCRDKKFGPTITALCPCSCMTQ